MYAALRPWLFSFEPEVAHAMALSGLRAWGAFPSLLARHRQALRADDPSRALTLGSLRVPNSVGLAAGLDKNAQAVDGLFGLGFGFIEVGAVTPRAQPGNARPRVFRLKGHEAIINRMGFNNDGAEAVAERLRRVRFRPGAVGVNLGKNKDTPLERAADDFAAVAREVDDCADFVVVNVSSPNTPGLRGLQAAESLKPILEAVRHATKRPVWVKLSPDLFDAELTDVVTVCIDAGIEVVVATNTTLSRPVDGPLAQEQGGLSGPPLLGLSTQVLARAVAVAAGRLEFVGSGGVHDGPSARAKWAAGARAVEVYTGLIYRGPALVNELLAEADGA